LSNRFQENQEILPPETLLRASKVGTLIGILLVVWAGVFSLYESSLSSSVYWTVGIAVSILIVTIPCWLVGQRAKREYLKKRDPAA